MSFLWNGSGKNVSDLICEILFDWLYTLLLQQSIQYFEVFLQDINKLQTQQKPHRKISVNPNICYACRMINYVCALLLLFLCCLLADSLLFLPPFFSLFLFCIMQAPCAFLPLQVANLLFFAYVSLTSLSFTPLHYDDQLRIALRKRTFILLDSLIPKNLHYNLLIHLFKACFTPHEKMHWERCEFCLFFVGLT